MVVEHGDGVWCWYVCMLICSFALCRKWLKIFWPYFVGGYYVVTPLCLLSVLPFQAGPGFQDATHLYHRLFSLYVHIPRSCSSSTLSFVLAFCLPWVVVSSILLSKTMQKGFTASYPCITVTLKIFTFIFTFKVKVQASRSQCWHW